MSDEHETLASAYVDGEVTDDVRRIAEADPAVMAEVAAIRAARDALADIPIPDESTKRAAIAAAMAEFRPADVHGPTTTPAPTPAAATPPTGSRRASSEPARSRRMARWLQVAAVAGALGLGGLVVARFDLGGDDDDDSVAREVLPADEATDDRAADEPADEQVGESDDGAIAATGSLEELEGDQAADEPAEEPADEPAEQPADEPAEEPAAADETAEASATNRDADESSDDAAADLADEPPDEGPSGGVEYAERGYSAALDLTLVGRTSLDPITTEADLLAYAAAVAEAAANDRAEPDLPSIGSCEIDIPILADAFVDAGEGPTLALVGIDEGLSIARAYDPITCDILLEV